jgi:hypothetical protein
MSDSCICVKCTEIDKSESYIITAYRADFLSFFVQLTPYESGDNLLTRSEKKNVLRGIK